MSLATGVTALAARIAEEFNTLRGTIGSAEGIAGLDDVARLVPSQAPLAFSHAVSSATASTTSFTPVAPSQTVRTARITTGATATLTINVPSGAVYSTQVMRVRIYNNSGAAQNIQFHANYRTSTGLTRGPHSIPNGEMFISAIEYMGYNDGSAQLTGEWAITAYTTTAA